MLNCTTCHRHGDKMPCYRMRDWAMWKTARPCPVFHVAMSLTTCAAKPRIPVVGTSLNPSDAQSRRMCLYNGVKRPWGPGVLVHNLTSALSHSSGLQQTCTLACTPSQQALTPPHTPQVAIETVTCTTGTHAGAPWWTRTLA